MSMHISQKRLVFKNDTGHYVKINTFQFVINKVCIVSGPDTVCLYGFSICRLFSCFPNELSFQPVFLVIKTCMSRPHISLRKLAHITYEDFFQYQKLKISPEKC